jgi:ATP-dependent RNA helicase RhlE
MACGPQVKEAQEKLNSTPNGTEAAQLASRPTFASLGLGPSLVEAVADEGYETPTPIQLQAIPHVVGGRDVLGCAQTGTGKTAAFLLPVLQRLAALPCDGRVRALVLAPTRELAIQIGERASAYGRLCKVRHVVIYGGVGQRDQERALRAKPDLLIATPGRLVDLITQGVVTLGGVRMLVLDEADRMLDMGFIRDVRRIIAFVPKQRQTLLFSATMPGDIAELARDVMVEPTRLSVRPEVTTADRVAQVVHLVTKTEKRALLEHVLRTEKATRTLVFTRTKHGANRLADQLARGGIPAVAIHGNKSQSARERALEAFRRGATSVLVATDIAARGIDVDGITHVVNYELPDVPEQYVHRIGRTGRAGAEGRAISLVSEDERALLADVERFIRTRIEVVGSTHVGSSDAAPRRENEMAAAEHRTPQRRSRRRTWYPRVPSA